ncbi:30S ribosomal protein S20 [PVC group bacterium (ex Bugula neritina AB1)]|nr:30S ribosomal protein S20 [PVC group bacterium (ex Bugula neritina AB1)]
MPNLRSAKKRVKTNEIKRLANNIVKSKMKTFVKKTYESISSGNKSEADLLIRDAFSSIDRAAKKNLIHKNYASRHKARLSKALATIQG